MGEQKAKRFLETLSRLKLNLESTPRYLALYSAAIALADKTAIKAASLKANRAGARIPAIYEIMLQSYLFLGFPRMLTAAECFRETFPDFDVTIGAPKRTKRFGIWKGRGEELCRKVYADNFEKLKKRVRHFSQEIFEWMILEGYGKVLSRPGLDIKKRELAIVAMLMVDNRPKQMFSHIRGALNVGVSRKLLRTVIVDISRVTGEDSKTALSFLQKIEN